MPDREGSRFSAGGGNRLNVIRYGREEMTQHELIAGDNILPGQALMRTEDAEGNPVFEHHDGDETNAVYVAVEARGRGMDAQTDSGYAAGEDLVIAVNASGGGLNLRVAADENLSQGDTIGPAAVTGDFVGYVDGTGTFPFAEADETMDLTGFTDPALVRSEVS